MHIPLDDHSNEPSSFLIFLRKLKADARDCNLPYVPKTEDRSGTPNHQYVPVPYHDPLNLHRALSVNCAFYCSSFMHDTLPPFPSNATLSHAVCSSRSLSADPSPNQACNLGCRGKATMLRGAVTPTNKFRTRVKFLFTFHKYTPFSNRLSRGQVSG